MRILSISGQNIASLGDVFAIDFTAPPLSGAGLFAIIGETGAGKSSILDAMCLALYGEAPRLSAGARTDRIPDIEGDEISAADPRAILRRGAAQGWAEVRFTGLDGQDYTAHWSARRARDRAEGRLQNVSRSLARVSDGQVLAGQTTAVSEQVIALTGLSYDEFRRTVLLAQGDFDAFLRADTNDRAGLLEKVTGTGLYRAVSIRVYDRCEAARAAHAELLARQAEHRLLPEEDRAALSAEAQALAAENATAGAEREARAQALEQHRRLAEAERQQALAEAALGAATAAQTGAAPERGLLAQIEAAEPLRLPWQAVAQAQTTWARSQALCAAAETAVTSATTGAETQAGAALAARALHDEKELAFKALGPIWDEAARLDAQILTAATEASAAQSRAKAQAEASATQAQGLAALQAEQGKTEAALRAAEAALAARALALPLLDLWPQVRRDLADHATAAQAAQHAAKRHAAARTQAATAAQEAAEAEAAEAQDRQAEAALAAQGQRLSTRLDPLEAAHPPARSGALAALASDLAELDRAARDASSGVQGLALAQAAQGGAETEAKGAAAESQQAEQALAEAEGRITALTAPLEAADRALSDAARALRAQLAPGEPCPVCGATEHPAPADAVLSHLAETMRADLAAARVAAQTARTRLTQAQGAAARAEARRQQAMAEATKAEALRTRARALWAEVLARAQARPLCPALPAGPEADPAQLAQAQAEVAALQEAETQAQRGIALLRADITETERKRETLRRTLSAHQANRARIGAAQSGSAQEAALAQQAQREAEAQMARLAAALAPALAAAQEPMTALAAAQEPKAALGTPDLARRLAALVAELGAAREALTQAQTGLAALAPRLAAARIGAETAQAQAQALHRDAEARSATLSDLRAARAPLLDGLDTATHRSRCNETRIAAQKADAAAQSALSTAQADLAAALSRRAEAAQGEAEAQSTLSRAQAELEARQAEAGIAAAQLAELFAHPRAEIEALRARLRGFDDAVTAAQSALAQRIADLATLAALGLPEAAPEALAQALADLDAASLARNQRIGTVQNDLARDAATRAELAGLAAQTETARAEHEIWQAVNAAIGSRQGDRFARVAQAITLDVLVDHANHHLADLNPRYRLRRGAELALHIEDRDMGNEPRATRSLSGGERFLVSLSLALALAQMGGKGTFAGTLFIDEGFGALDAASLDLAIDALENLQSQGRQVGVISHVEAMQARIPTRIAVRKQGGGKSTVRVEGIGGVVTGG